MRQNKRRLAGAERGLKIMKLQEEQPDSLPMLLGLGRRRPSRATCLLAGGARAAGSGAAAADGKERLEQLKELLEGWKPRSWGAIAPIDLSEENEAYFVYQGRIKVLLGTFNNLEYKLSAAGLLLRNESGEYLSASDRGTLDVSHQMEGAVVRMPFSPGDFEVGERRARTTR